MNEMTAYVVFDADRSEYAGRLIGALSAELRAQILEAGREEPATSDVPSFQRCEGIENLPLPGEIGPMSLVILILPGRAFTEAEAARIAAFEIAVGEEVRLLPVAAPGVDAAPPPPLAPYVSAPGNDSDAFNMKQMATWLLIQFYLRASCDEKSVFISYRTKDGKAAAARLAAGLAERRFAVFRDENLDDDQQKSLKWGTKAQQTLTERINRHGVLLLVDTPEAFGSPWVRIEVDSAHAQLKPIFPVVFHPAALKYKDVGHGGRFPINRANQVGMSCPYETLTEEGVEKAIDKTFLDNLVIELGMHLAQHLHVMRYLVRSTDNQFQQLKFHFDEVDGDRLHLAWAERHHATTPRLRFRFLIKVSPYKSLVAQDVMQMKQLLKNHGEYCQYGLLVERGLDRGGYATFRDELVDPEGGHLMILYPDQIREMAERLLAPGVGAMSDIPWVALSGAVPEQKELHANGWSGVGISIFVKRLVDRVMQAGGGITMGSHPTFLDDIRDVAIAYTRPDEPKRWKIWVGRRYYPTKPERDEYESKYGPFAEIRWVGKLDPKGPLTDEEIAALRQAVLTSLRTGFIKASRALVCVGGRPTRRDENGNVIARAGVEEESEIAWKLKRPLYFFGAGGGVAGKVYGEFYRDKLNPKTNGLTPEINNLIATHKDPYLGVSYVIEGLGRVKVLKRASEN